MAKRSVSLLLLSVGFLLGVGIIMLISTCAFSETSPADDIYKDAKRQVVWILAGVVVCGTAACVDYRWLQKRVWWIVGFVTLLLALCYVPGVGQKINGEYRWINAAAIGLRGLQVQPSELAKITIAVFLAYWFALHTDSGKHPLRGFLIPVSITGLVIALVLFEKDMGTAAVLSASCLTLLFAAGVRWYYLGTLLSVGVTGLALLVKFDPHRMARIMAYLDMDANKLGFAFQQWIGLMALGSGGPTGRGLGEGRLKMLYMPFAHTDFIFPMIGEELGLACTLLVVFAFLVLAVAGITIAFHAPDTFGRLLGLGLVSFIVFQAALNIGVTTAVLPNTGLPLPFVSYGGSALLTVMAAIGILLNIYRQGRTEEAENRYWVNAKRITPRI
ncbi:MAG: cell division protein FtsW [Verrucomicrobiae bacterium]|nr:cell division protein FtsW [Verrucomicrobiae bacterium]